MSKASFILENFICAGLHGVPSRRAPMVEQGVQTMPLAAAVQKKGKTPAQPESRQPVRPSQRSNQDSSQALKENVPASKGLILAVEN